MFVDIYVCIYPHTHRYNNACSLINRCILTSNLKFQYTVQFQFLCTTFIFTPTASTNYSLVTPPHYSGIVFVNITLAVHLTRDLPIHILLWKPISRTDIHWIFGAVLFVITWTDHLSLRIVWLLFFNWFQKALQLLLQHIPVQTRLTMWFYQDCALIHVGQQESEYLNCHFSFY